MNTWKTGILLGALVLSFNTGCSDDDEPAGTGGASSSGGAAGSAGSGGAAGSAGSGGAAGSAGSGGAAGSAGSGGAAGSAGSGGAAGSAGSAGSAGAGGQGGAAGGTGGASSGPANPTSIAVVTAVSGVAERLLVAGTDFATTTEIATVDPVAKTVLGRASIADGDAVPAASGGLGFALERTADQVDVLGADGSITATIDVTASPTGSATNQQKAYVTLYGRDHLAVLDLTEHSVQKRVDLSSFAVAGDGDGSVDADSLVIDRAGNRAYMSLGRIDRSTITAPDYKLACPNAKSLIIALDTTTDALVGAPIELELVNPTSVALDLANARLIVTAAGCYEAGGAARSHAGVELVDLTTGATTVRWQPAADDFVSGLLHLGGNRVLLNRFDPSFTEHWTLWDLTGAGPGDALIGVPTKPAFDGADGLFGVGSAASGGGAVPTVVSYALATKASDTLVSQPWTSDSLSAAGTALVR